MLLLFRYLLRLWRERKARPTDPPSASDSGVFTHAQAGTHASSNPHSPSRNQPPRARRPSAASRGPIALLAHQVRYDLRAGVRNPRARFFTFFFPIVMLVIFAGVFHGTTTVDGTHVKLSRYFLAGILAMSIVIAAYANQVVSIAALRESGVLKRRRATPISPTILIAGQAVSTVATAAVMSTILLLLAKVLYGVGMASGAIAAIACTAILGTLTFACIGYAVSGLIGSPDAAQPIVQATTMPLWFISGVLIPTQNLSSGLRSLGTLFPVEHLAAGLHLASVHTSFTSAISINDLLALAAWGVAAAAFAAWRFSWLPSTATT
jgi:ABC-2 type transport system permease protein